MEKKMKKREKIDFVIIWVDGNDPMWRVEKDYWVQKEHGIENPKPLVIDFQEERYRDWDLLRYWFRAVEQYAPWVNKVHFVTCGQKPDWLNPDAPKLNLVDHKDYIPEEFLPTFSSHPIELNLHRIPGLSEKFVYFCDDFFLNAPVKPEDFFVKGLPCDSLEEFPVQYQQREQYNNIRINDLVFASEHFPRQQVIKKNLSKWFSLKTPVSSIHNLVMRGFRLKSYAGIHIHHLPQAYLKSTLKEVWRIEPEMMKETCSHRFRNQEDVSQCVFKFYQLLSGQFMPYDKRKFGKSFEIGRQLEQIVATIGDEKTKAICLNDSHVTDYENSVKALKNAFEKALSDKSSFEL